MRYRLREGLRWVTSLERVSRCGEALSDVAIKRQGGRAWFEGVRFCGSVHACPVCSAVIRSKRATELTEGVGRWLEEGHGALMVTLTAPHAEGEPLDALWKGISASWSTVLAANGGKGLRVLGLEGWVRAFEVTRGVNGWHPHLHVLLFLDKPADAVAVTAWSAVLRDRWEKAVVRRMGRVPSRVHGVNVLPVVNNAAMLAYVGKVDGGATIGNELARLDMKTGRRASRSPMSLLADVVGDPTDDDRWLWREYEQASLGKRCLTWSKGMRQRLALPEEVSDDEVAETPEIIGEESVQLVRLVPRAVYEAWRRLGKLGEVLERYEPGEDWPAARPVGLEGLPSVPSPPLE